jgi:hypothetical protein
MTKKEFAEHKKRVAALPKPVLRWESLGKQVYHLSCGLTQVALVNRDGDGRYVAEEHPEDKHSDNRCPSEPHSRMVSSRAPVYC